LAAGEVRLQDVLYFSLFHIAAALILLSACSVWAALTGVALFINQCIYSFRPIRLKRYLVLDAISAAVFSHGARFAVGLQSGPVRQAAGYARAALILWKVAAYIAYRLEDAPGGTLGRTGTVAHLGVWKSLAVSAVAIIASFVCFGVYSVRTHMAAGAALSIILLYIIAVALYSAFFRQAACPKCLRSWSFPQPTPARSSRAQHHPYEGAPCC
jgi:4-hydroxybenzoate polyprenyltransferase